MYNQIYNSVITQADTKYKSLHNLYLLKGIRRKIECYKANSSKPDEYYDCFINVEQELISKSQQFIKDCTYIDDEYTICLSDCKQNFESDSDKKKQCFSKCGIKFRNSVSFLYDNFYVTNVGKQPQYKNCKKA